MRISFHCHKCGTTGKAPESYAGKAIECPGCKATVGLPPVAPPVASEQSSETAGDSGLYAMVHVVGFVIIIGAGLAGIGGASDYPTDRFHSDNAYGASANALEDIQRSLTVWGWVFLGVGIIACSKLTRIIHLLQGR